MMQFSLLLDQGNPDMDNEMFSGSEIPSQLGLLLVDDEEFNLKALKRTLRGQGFKIFCAPDGENALRIMEEEDIAIIVSDMRMPNMSGDELLIKIGERWPDTLKIILTGHTDISNTLNVLSSSTIFRYISKPWDDEFLLSTIHEAAAIYWGLVMDYYFENSAKKQNQKLKDSNLHLRESVDKSHFQLKKINEKLKNAYEGEKKLRKERLDAERESIAKSQFLATMSHEIRTPLNSIIATSSLLLESTLSDEQKELVNLSLNGGTTLLSLINDILDFSKINAGKLELHEEWFELIPLIDETCELLSGQIINKPVDIVSIIQAKTPSQVCGDKNRIRQILTNLISNALKFTESGCVEVEVSYDAGLKVVVNDSGIGMAENEVIHIFDEFTQVDNSNTRTKGGTGLGLSICKQLCHLMQGKIAVHSELNKGSRFTINLPLSCRNPIGLPKFQGEGSHALLVSTNTYLHASLEKQLTCFNCKLHLTEIPPEQSPHNYDAILYDTDSVCISSEHLIDTDRIKSPNFIEVALISNDGVGHSKTIKNLGFSTVLRKPFRISSIVKHLIYNINPTPVERNLSEQERKIIQQWRNIESQKCAPKNSYSLGATILLAEDSPSNQAIIKSVLKNMDVNVDIANNGEEAIRMVGNKVYDIILMDMAMPIVDGITAAKSIIESKGINSKTPIIALTANAYAEDKKSCLDAGMVDFLQKPIDIHLFRSKISEWCKPQDKTLKIIPDMAGPIDTENPSYIDRQVIIQLEKDTSREVLPSIIDIFLEETQERLPAMIQLCEKQDWPGLSREAHTLKSSAGSFGAVKLNVIAREIEEAIKSGDTEEVKSLNAKLPHFISSTIIELNDIKLNGV